MADTDRVERHATTENTRMADLPPSTPRWVKIFGIIIIGLILLVGIMLLSGGEHGPDRHAPPTSATEAHTSSTEHGAQQP